MSAARGVTRTFSSKRAQSEALGTVLVISMVIATAAIVIVFGSSAIGDSEQGLSVDRAAKALTQLDSRAALVALENTDIQQVSFASDDGEFRVRDGTDWMRIGVTNTTSDVTTTVVNQSLGSVEYENGRHRVVYQGGGVWKSSGEGSVMVSPPEFHYRNGTLTVPIVNVTGDPALGAGASLSHVETARKFPVSSHDDRRNPLDQHRVFVVVRSDHYEAWGRYFEERTDGVVSYDHARNVATLELVSPIGRQKVTAAAASRAASGSFELHGSAKVRHGPTVYTNSYDSRTGSDYQSQALAGTLGAAGDLVYGEDVDIDAGTGRSNIHGDVVSGKDVIVSGSSGGGQPDVEGDIAYTDACRPSISDCEDRIISASGEVRQISGVDTMNNINRVVEGRVEDLRSDNDNAAADISGDRLDFSASSPSNQVTLTAGRYYLADVDVGAGQELVLDTSGGAIQLAVEGGISLAGSGGGLGDGGTISVQGDGAVELSVHGDDSIHGHTTYDVTLGKNALVDAPGDNATQLRLYGPDDLAVRVGSGSGNLAKFVGVVFSPPGVAGDAAVHVTGGEVYGGVLTGTTTIDSGSIHYDEALATTQVISRDAKVVKVTYLHVTVNRIDVQNR